MKSRQTHCPKYREMRKPAHSTSPWRVDPDAEMGSAPRSTGEGRSGHKVGKHVHTRTESSGFFFEQLRFLVKLPDLDFHGDNFKFLSS